MTTNYSHLIILFVCICSLASSVASAAIYVDCELGNDSNDGQSSSSAIQTIAKLNSLINAGFFDLNPPFRQILFKSGCVFSDAGLTLNNIQNLVVSNYSDGSSYEMPILDTSTRIRSTWTFDSDMNAYQTSISDILDVSSLFVDNQAYNQSHFPLNPHVNYLYLPEATNGSTVYLPSEAWSLTDEQLLASNIVFRPVRWAFHKTNIVAVDRSNSSITVGSTGDYFPIDANWGFFFMNAQWMLDPGMFFYNTSTETLWLSLDDSSDPNLKTITFQSTDNSSTSVTFGPGSSNVTLSNIHIRNAHSTGVDFGFASNCTVSRCYIEQAGFTGIQSSSSRNVVTDSTVVRSGSNNFAGGSDITLVRNTFLDSFVYGCLQVQFVNTAILGSNININSCNGCALIQNRVDGCGYIGINIGGHSGTVYRNHVSRACLVADDCGLIYWWGRTSGGHLIQSNLFQDAIGNSYGTPYSSLGYSGPANGIYFDDGTANSTVVDNVVINANWGTQIHNSANNQIQDNIFWASRAAAVVAGDDTTSPWYPVGGYCHNNSFLDNVAHSTSSTTMSISGSLNVTLIFNQYDDYNAYFPNRITYSLSSGGVSLKNLALTLSQWQQQSGSLIDTSVDEHSWVLGNKNFQIVPFIILSSGDNEVPNGNFTSDITDWSSYPSSDVNSTWDETAGALRAQVLASPSDTTILFAISSGFNLTKDQSYVLQFDLWLDPENNEHTSDQPTVIVRLDGPPYTSYFSVDVSINQTRTTFTSYFNASIDVSPARIDFQDTRSNCTYFVDNVALFPASVRSASSNFSFFYNTDMYSSLTLDTQNQYCYDDGILNPVTSDIVLPPLGAVALLNCYCNLDGICNNLENIQTCPEDGCTNAAPTTSPTQVTTITSAQPSQSTSSTATATPTTRQTTRQTTTRQTTTRPFTTTSSPASTLVLNSVLLALGVLLLLQ